MFDIAKKSLLASLYDAAVEAAQPESVLSRYLPDSPAGRLVVIGAGKASAQMGQAFVAHWDGPVSGLIVTRYGFGCAVPGIEVVEASHPVPDAAGAHAAERLLDLVGGLTPDDLVLALISGGGSALLPAPAAGLSLADEQALNQALLMSGAPIGAMNAIRKQFSRVKGGRLAAASGAPVRTLVISDVPGDDPAMVASGPTVPDETSRADARALIEKWKVQLPERMVDLFDGLAAAPHPDDPVFARNEVTVIASAAMSLAAAGEAARGQGLSVDIGSDAVEGEASDVGRADGKRLRELAGQGTGRVLLSGGETTVTVSGKAGRGGRNSEYLLALALEIEGVANVTALAADTDGVDGSEDNAGAFADGTSVGRMRAAGLDPAAMLANHDSYSAFQAIGDLFMTGPTGTNVNDFRAHLIG